MTAALDCWREKMVECIDKEVALKANGVKQQQLEPQVDQVQMSWVCGPVHRDPVLVWMKYHKLTSITVTADGALTYVRAGLKTRQTMHLQKPRPPCSGAFSLAARAGKRRHAKTPFQRERNKADFEP